MNLTPAVLKKSIEAKGYVWYNDRPNLVAIRTTLQVPDVFNDLFVMCWKQPELPVGLDLLNTQRWLNDFLYDGENGKELVEDGAAGKNTTFALANLNSTIGMYRLKSYVITTDPGLYWLNHPLSKLGAAVLKPGQYVNAYQLGLHQGKKEHPALIQTGGYVTVYRDFDRDNIAEETNVQETGHFGINIHRASATGATTRIGKFSAGCTVFSKKTDHDEVLMLCGHYKQQVKNLFTYTLLREKELLSV